MSNVFTAQLALWRRLDPVLAQSAISSHSVRWHPVCCLSTPVVKPHNILPSSLWRTHNPTHSPHHGHLDARIIRSLVHVLWWRVQKHAGRAVPRFLCTVGRLLHNVSSLFKDRTLFVECDELLVAALVSAVVRAGNILAGWVHINYSRRACPHLGSWSNCTVNYGSAKVIFLLDILYEVKKECLVWRTCLWYRVSN